MQHSDLQYTRLRWLLTISGLFLYLFDICTDIALALKYFHEGHFIWSGLTGAFVAVGLLVTQIFSYCWYRDDMGDVFLNPEGKASVSHLSKATLAAVHLCGMGVFTRFYQLLKKGFSVVWRSTHLDTLEERREAHHRLFCLATDLSMLKLFEAFLESVPQLLLQLYIVLSHDECLLMQYLSMSCSFLSIAWALVDYRRCLRRSLPEVTEMPSGIPTMIYLLYKLCTITSHILSFTLLLLLSAYSAVAFAVLWIIWTIWANLLQTEFCSSKGLEMLYRAVVGVILTFTFFNVKGKDTRVAMTLYYLFFCLLNISSPLLLLMLGPETQSLTFLLTVCGLIYSGLVVGLVCLVLYYLLLHPGQKWREADEVDGLEGEADATRRSRNFLQP